MAKAIEELKLLDRNLFVNQECVNAIKKANKIDYDSLLSHFRQLISDVQHDFDFNLKVEMNASKREEFRRVLNSLIGIRAKGLKSNTTERFKLSNTNRANFSPFQQIRRVTEEDIKKSKMEYVVNPPPLSADRLLSQAAFKIEC
jgi:hypothetical protein